MEKPTRTIKNGFKMAEKLSKAKKPLALIFSAALSLFITTSVTNSASDKK